MHFHLPSKTRRIILFLAARTAPERSPRGRTVVTDACHRFVEIIHVKHKTQMILARIKEMMMEEKKTTEKWHF